MLFKGPGSLKKNLKSAEMAMNERPIDWYHPHPPLFFHFTLPLRSKKNWPNKFRRGNSLTAVPLHIFKQITHGRFKSMQAVVNLNSRKFQRWLIKNRTLRWNFRSDTSNSLWINFLYKVIGNFSQIRR
jgi:hypothetical protein